MDFVFAELAERYPDRAAARGWTTLAPNRSPPDHPDAGARVTVTHSDPEASAHLNRHLASARVFEMVADRLVEDRPARPLARASTSSLADRDDRLRAITTPSRDDDSVPTPEREKDEHILCVCACVSRADTPSPPSASPRAPPHPSISPRRPDRDREGEAEAVDNERGARRKIFYAVIRRLYDDVISYACVRACVLRLVG